MPKVKRGLTTGGVARMLGVSRSKVERLFDQGVLTGWKHPIVGWRSIDRESVEAFMAIKRRTSSRRKKKAEKQEANPNLSPKEGLC